MNAHRLRRRRAAGRPTAGVRSPAIIHKSHINDHSPQQAHTDTIRKHQCTPLIIHSATWAKTGAQATNERAGARAPHGRRRPSPTLQLRTIQQIAIFAPQSQRASTRTQNPINADRRPRYTNTEQHCRKETAATLAEATAPPTAHAANVALPRKKSYFSTQPPLIIHTHETSSPGLQKIFCKVAMPNFHDFVTKQPTLFGETPEPARPGPTRAALWTELQRHYQLYTWEIIK